MTTWVNESSVVDSSPLTDSLRYTRESTELQRAALATGRKTEIERLQHELSLRFGLSLSEVGR